MQKLKGNKFCVYAFAEEAAKPIDLFKAHKRKDIIVDKGFLEVKSDVNMGGADQLLDVTTWLPFAAKEYCLSGDITDYVFVPVITMPSELPNRNGVGFPLRELVAWNVEHGRQAYKTFKGKPCYVEHKNDVPSEASGVIVDAYMKKMAGFGDGKVWKLLELLAFDRTKNPGLVSQILSGEMNSYSMGAMVAAYTCSICHQELGRCSHLNTRAPFDFNIQNGQLAFRQVAGIVGFETSAVGTPAFVSAISDERKYF